MPIFLEMFPPQHIGDVPGVKRNTKILLLNDIGRVGIPPPDRSVSASGREPNLAAICSKVGNSQIAEFVNSGSPENGPEP